MRSGKDISAIVKLIERIEDKVWKSGCRYLYDDYDELMTLLNTVGRENLTAKEVASLRGLVSKYAYESVYDNSSMVSWTWYSVRAFYCADSLVGYLPEKNHEFFYGLLNQCFLELVQNGRAPIIEREMLERYLQMNITDDNYKDLYSKLILKSAREIHMSRLWKPDENELAYAYVKTCTHIIRDYLARYKDRSVLKEWLPMFDVVRVEDSWRRYPESTDFEDASESTRKAVDDRLYKMMNMIALIDILKRES